MTNAQKIALRLSQVRARLNEIAGLEGDALTDEIRSEAEGLQNEYRDLEVRSQAAIVAGEVEPTETRTDDTEDRELRALVSDASLGAIFTAALEHRSTDGREAELQQHFNLGANQVPLAMLETRAATPAPGDVGTNQAEIIPAVFPMACASFLGVDMPTVPVGEAVFPVLSASAVVGAPAEGAVPTGRGLGSLGETTGAFTADVLSPKRLQAAFFYSREDRSRFAGMDSALRMNLSDALSDALDQQILAGTEGLFTGTNLADHDVTALTTYALYRSQLGYGRVDGTYAGTVADLRIVMGATTYGHAAGTFRSDNAGDRAALEDLMQVTGGVKVSAHVPAAAGAKMSQEAIVRLGMRRDMVAPLWEGVTLIPDEITRAANGEIVVTAVMLHAVKILRAAGFYKQQVQTLA